MNEDQYRKLKLEVEESKSEAERAQGALDQLLARLKEEFDCSNLKEAKRLLDDLESKRDRAQKSFQEAMTNYQKKWRNDQS
jgi:hypothetical protein